MKSNKAKNTSVSKTPTYSKSIMVNVGRLEALRTMVNPKGAIIDAVAAVSKYCDQIDNLTLDDKHVLMGALETVCPSYPIPVPIEREDIVSIFEGTNAHDALALKLAVAIILERLTHHVTNHVANQQTDWLWECQHILHAEWWRQVLSDMEFLRPHIFDEDRKESLIHLDKIDPIPPERLLSAKTRSGCHQDQLSRGRQQRLPRSQKKSKPGGTHDGVR